MTISKKKAYSEDINSVLHALLNEINGVLLKFSIAANRVEDEKPDLDVYSQMPLLVWARISERKLDTELRSLLEDDRPHP